MNWKNNFYSIAIFVFMVGLYAQFACQNRQVETEDKTGTNSITIPEEDTLSITSFIMGQFEASEHPDFVLIDTIFADREGLWLQKDSYNAFKAMHDKAMKAGISLVIRSATRNFYAQKNIWEDKWDGKRILSDGTNAATGISDPVDRALKILEYSSMPGTSRHHWGTDIDLNSFENNWFASGEGKKLYDWMLANAGSFGFCQPYTEKNDDRPNGYNEEKWHWSYIPLAKTYTDKASELISNEMINGFNGSATANDINVKQNYILGINNACL